MVLSYECVYVNFNSIMIFNVILFTPVYKLFFTEYIYCKTVIYLPSIKINSN